MGNQQLQQRIQNGQISVQDLIRLQSGQLDVDDLLFQQHYDRKKQQKITIDEEYLKRNKNYYNYTKRIYRNPIQKLKNKKFEKKTQIEKEQQRKQQDFKYQEDDLHYYIPNKYQVIKQTQIDPYNISMNTNGSQMLITSRQGLDVYSEKNQTNKYEFESQIFPGTISWTITDSDLSRDDNLLVHSTMNPVVSIYSLQKNKYVHMLNMSDNPEQEEDDWEYRLRIFSVKFNSDSSKLIASTGGNQQNLAQLKLYDVQHQYLQNSIPAHTEDINTICYVNKENSNVFISGSDDSLIKIWDTRALGVNNKPQGYLLGHCCGITKVSSREDGFYIASNSKDQACKLWDLRKSCESNEGKPSKAFYYDYRGQCLSQDYVNKIKGFQQNQHFDNSVHSFYGHSVFRTLIRCHFSPQSPTGSRYIYTGSGCGKVFIYDIMTGKTAAVLDSGDDDVVRDLQWHPNKHKIFVAGWDGNLVEWSFDPDFTENTCKKKQNSNENDEDDGLEEEKSEVEQLGRNLNSRFRQNMFQNRQVFQYSDDDEEYDYDEEEFNQQENNENELDEEIYSQDKEDSQIQQFLTESESKSQSQSQTQNQDNQIEEDEQK